MPTRNELAFLKSQRIPESMVFHAAGLPKQVYLPLMRERDAILVTGARPCNAGGHTIRTRAGHCAQCNTARIAFQRRHQSPGFVYVAASMQLGLLKIGSSSNPGHRLCSLNSQGYAGCSDWQLLDQEYSDCAGRSEFEVHEELDSYREPTYYRRDGYWVECRETFRIAASAAIQTMITCCR